MEENRIVSEPYLRYAISIFFQSTFEHAAELTIDDLGKYTTTTHTMRKEHELD